MGGTSEGRARVTRLGSRLRGNNEMERGNDRVACRIVYERGMWYLSWKALRMLMNFGVRRARASLAILSGTPP